MLSKNDLSVLVPILEETPGWNALQIRDLFSSCGVAIHEWDKIRTDWLTFHRIPTLFVVNEIRTNDSKLLPAAPPRCPVMLSNSIASAALVWCPSGVK